VPSTRVRLFQQITQLLLGGTADSEIVGLSPGRRAVIETDGAIEQPDSLKVAYDGLRLLACTCATTRWMRCSYSRRWRVGSSTCSRLLGGAGLAASARSAAAISQRIATVGASGSRIPPVYCPDRRQLIGHVRAHKPTTMPGSPAPAAQ